MTGVGRVQVQDFKLFTIHGKVSSRSTVQAPCTAMQQMKGGAIAMDRAILLTVPCIVLVLLKAVCVALERGNYMGLVHPSADFY
jgi:hypothetical protein